MGLALPLCKTNPLTRMGDLWVILKHMAPLIRGFGSEHDPIISLHHNEVDLGLVPREKSAIFIVLDVINTLDPFTCEIMGSRTSKAIVNEVKTLRPPNVRMEKFHKGVGGGSWYKPLIMTFHTIN